MTHHDYSATPDDIGMECALPHIEPPASEPKGIDWQAVALWICVSVAFAAVLVASVWGRA